jgi:hypothetical protein
MVISTAGRNLQIQQFHAIKISRRLAFRNDIFTAPSRGRGLITMAHSAAPAEGHSEERGDRNMLVVKHCYC